MKQYIHYCWFGPKKKPRLAKKCIRSWKKYLPDYEIVEWNEENFDVGVTDFSAKAYQEKKWAFVSDVARVYALKQYGGIYFDTDMLLRKKIPSLTEHAFFAGWETPLNVAAGVIGVKQPDNHIIRQLFDYYQKSEFDVDNMYQFSIPTLLTNILRSEYDLQPEAEEVQTLKNDTVIYPRDYFYPLSCDGMPDQFTENTCMVHYYGGTWLPGRDRLVFKTKRLLGQRLGEVVLRLLVLGKKVVRFGARILLFPLVLYRRQRWKRAFFRDLRTEIDDLMAQLPESDSLAIYNRQWLGTGIATGEIFPCALGIEETPYTEQQDYLAEKILQKGYRLVVFSAFACGWKEIVEKLHQKEPSMQIKVLWHGSNCMNVEAYDYDRFMEIFQLLRKKQIASIGFVKKSMYEFYRAKGFSVEFVMNTLRLDPEKYRTKPALKNDAQEVKIGLYASGDRWVKNFYNQLCAASLVEHAVVDCVPAGTKTYQYAQLLRLRLTGSNTTLSREKLLCRLAQNDINLYVTFTECAPLLPLESLELGVVCITANNHHYFEGTALEEYLIVRDTDNVMKIHEKIELCLNNRAHIIALYRSWKKEYDALAQKSIADFLAAAPSLPGEGAPQQREGVL